MKIRNSDHLLSPLLSFRHVIQVYARGEVFTNRKAEALPDKDFKAPFNKGAEIHTPTGKRPPLFLLSSSGS
ncbi:hypothetical protein B4096_0022 [Heyndrickxia coagulans]|nr:hypothetical protein B4096_0022 [Heyndrickxia coagulans]